MTTTEEELQSFNVATAVAYVGYDLSERNLVVRGSPVEELITAWSHQGTKNAYGSASAATIINNIRADLLPAVHDAVTARQLTSVYIPADQLINAIPVLYKVVNDRAPVVFHVAINSTDLSPVLAVRQTGVTLLPSHGVQDTHYTAILSHLIALRTRLPVVHFYDTLSQDTRQYAKIRLVDYKRLGQVLPNQAELVEKYRSGNGLEEVDSISEQLEASSLYINRSATIEPQQIANTVSIFLHKELPTSLLPQTKSFEYTGPADATDVIVVLAIASPNLEKAALENGRTGVVRVRVYRPWSDNEFLAALPKSVRRIAVLDTSFDIIATAACGPLFLDVAASFHSATWNHGVPTIREGRVHLVPAEGYATEVVQAAIAELAKDEHGPFEVGTAAPADSTAPKVNGKNGSSIDPESTPEGPYIKMLHQLFGDRATVANVATESTLWGNNAGPDAPEANAEFGFGQHLVQSQRRQRFINEVASIVKDPVQSDIPLPDTLRPILQKWLQYLDDPAKSTQFGREAADILASPEVWCRHPSLTRLHQDSAYFTTPSRWLIAGDHLAYDVGNSGVHHLISSRENINMLVLDTQPHSTRTSDQRRKKDIGLYAMQYGNVYVASVAVNASYAQVLRALMEADAYPGPAVILAYAPHIEKPRKGSSLPLEALKETKLAVDSGFWPLYRWNPTNDDQPFALDSAKIKKELQDFLDRENHLAYLVNTKAQLDPYITESAETELSKGVEKEITASYNALLASLNTAPLLILYGSDGGNGETVAKRLAGEAKQRGLRPRVSPADAVAVEDWVKEPSVVFVISTAGQGEFPGNARETWKQLNNATALAELDPSRTKVAVLALGDRLYWPLPEDKHYFAKPGKDLDAKLASLGFAKLVELGTGDDQDPDGLWTGVNNFRSALWSALGVDNVEVVLESSAPSDDAIKEASNYLRGTIAEGLADTSTGALAELDTKLLKFHGSYQQDDRDIRDARLRAGLELAYSFMVRMRLPGGVVTPEQWISVDDISEKFANSTIKITTRQTFQFHGIVKGKLKPSMKEMNRHLMDTIAACGDVNRNVLCSPNEYSSEINAAVLKLADDWSRHMLPHSNGYAEIFLDKTLISSTTGLTEEHEPIYGKTFLPRKFKTAIAVPPNNDVDIFANDLGYIAIVENERIVGYNVTVGGGMGMTHNNKKTYPRLADVICFCAPEEAIKIGELVVTIQRDFGDRTNRKHARLKYTIDDRGIEWFKEELGRRLGKPLQAPRPFKFTTNTDRFGWIKESNGLYAYTFHVLGGRIADTPKQPMRKQFRELAEYLLQNKAKYPSTHFRLTANQHMLLTHVPPTQKAVLEQLFKELFTSSEKKTLLHLNSMACVALPTCALAMAESERYLPLLLQHIDGLLHRHGLENEPIVMRMTGCPNSCARPQIAEIAFIGKAPGTYNMYLGGGFDGNRLNKCYRESVGEKEIIAELDVLFERFAKDRIIGERFGDWCVRAGIVKATREGKDFHD
ncbi:hypothetical protein BC832DRAFT_560149 [Gaertneriomyces semiglobifer]|nr:hypothetical protein BC832DRAFT_560149 [Gaertneriomyces semiglobifer]